MRRISDMMYPFSNSSSPLPGPTVSDLNTAATVTASSSPLISPPGLRLSDDAFSVRTDGGTDVLIQSLRALELPHDSAIASAGPLSSPLTRTRDFPSPGSCNSVVSLDPLPLPVHLPLPPQHPITLPMPQPLSLPPAPLSAMSTYTSTANRIQGHLSTIEKSRANAGAYSVPAEVLYRYTDPKDSAGKHTCPPFPFNTFQYLSTELSYLDTVQQICFYIYSSICLLIHSLIYPIHMYAYLFIYVCSFIYSIFT